MATNQLGFDFNPTTNSLQLPQGSEPVVPPKRKPTIDERFKAWAEKNPHVVESFCNIAERLVSVGEHVSARDIFGTLRADADLLPLGDEYKINNDFAAPMARLAEKKCPSLVGKFEFRVRTSQRK